MAQAKKSSKTTKKNTKRKENKKLLIVVAIIVVALIAVIGSSYAFFTTQLHGQKDNTIEVGTFVLNLNEASDGVSITNAVPVTETYALAHSTPYKFSLANTGSVDASYTLKMVEQAIGEGTKLPTNKIRYQLSYGATEGAKTTVKKGLVSELTSGSIDAGTIAAGDTNYYQLILWVDQDATKEEVAGTKYVAKIDVDAIQTYGME